MYTIYSCKNINDNKYYIGITRRTLEERKREHYQESNTTNFGVALKNDFSDCFEWKIIKAVEEEYEAFYLEQNYIKLLTELGFELYNMTLGGDGVHIREEKKDEWYKNHLEKLNWMHKDKKVNEKISNSLKQKYENPEYKEWRMSKLKEARNKRLNNLQVTKEDHKLLLKDKKEKKEKLEKNKVIEVISKTIYQSIDTASRMHKLEVSTIKYQIDGKRKIPLYSKRNKKLVFFEYIKSEDKL
jgi:hypothetical protein